MKPLEKEDIQGIICWDYSGLEAARFLLLEISDVPRAKEWLGSLEVGDSTAEPKNEPRENVAFTYQGLKKLGMEESALKSFSREFKEGMVAPDRQRILGDTDTNHPDNWRWGGTGKNQPVIHILLMLYAPDDVSLEDKYQNLKLGENGLVEYQSKDMKAHPLKDFKEHFGFRDGIAQPVIRGNEPRGQAVPPNNTVEPGEFLLGHPNEYGKISPMPMASSSTGEASYLHEGQLGLNGSYLVFRQLRQDVVPFWKFVKKAAAEQYPPQHQSNYIRLASKMVGRWPSGAPLVKAPDEDKPEHATADDFEYSVNDEKNQGDACPPASHIRRTNPRDSLENKPKESIKVAKRHRIIRRGRPYGEPADKSMEPEKILASGKSEGDRGLLFICLNANIARQFEFIQHTWINNPKFAGLHNDSDPLLGANNPKKKKRDFTEPAAPVRNRITGLEQFVTTVGGAYFFMPGLRAVKYLASLK